MATPKNIQNALQQPYDLKRFAADVLKPVFGETFAFAHTPAKPGIWPTASEQAVIKEALIYGGISLEDGTEITCYEILLQPTVRIEQSKVGIQQYVRKLVVDGEAALINFISPVNKDAWRFTLVATDTKSTEGDIITVKTNAKRYTYLVEKDRPNKTMADRMAGLSIDHSSMETLIKAFSVEAMSKAFFNEYKEHYQNFVEYLTGKRMVKVKGKWTEQVIKEPNPFLASIFNGKEKDARDFVKKLMGRIVFLYFVQKKRWLGATDTQYQDGPYDFISKLFVATKGNENFFPLGLSQLFFEALNKERPNDDWVMPVINKTVKIPYLNGGLFERDEIDELIHKKGDTLLFPPGLFSHVDKEDTPIERGFLDFLNAYNFTVYEDGEDDHTVAVDPEMLGHIFENLLEDNKDKGAFYTPKEIVHYMCQESLNEYLKTHLPKAEATIAALVRDKTADAADPATLKEIKKRLTAVKICDPAIGSGAFPMGLLQEIFSMQEVIAAELGEPFLAAEVKEQIISHSIYGVDIERGAVDIARLRFWLSLVVDEDKPKALPNLDYKIVVGDSLLSKFNGEVVEIDWNRVKSTASTKEMVDNIQKGLRDISTTQQKFFDPKGTNKGQLKQKIRDLKLDVLISQVTLRKIEFDHSHPEIMGIVLSAKEQKQNAERVVTLKSYTELLGKLKALKANPSKPFQHFDWKLDFPEVMNELVAGERTGFDIVIGNPPYGIWINEKDKNIFNEKYQLATYKVNLYVLFLERCFNLFPDSINSYIIPKSILNNSFFKSLREALLTRTSIREFYLIGEKVFEEAEVGGSLILSFINTVPNPDHLLSIYRSNDFEGDIAREKFERICQLDFLKIDSFEISATSSDRFNLIIRLSKLDKIQDHYDLKNGLNPGNVKSKLIRTVKSSSIDRPIIWGKDLSRYTIDWSGDFIHYNPDISLSVDDIVSKQGMKKQTRVDFALRDESMFETSKILVRKTGDKVIASLDEINNFYFDTLVHGIYQIESEYSLKYLLAIMNSSACTNIYRLLHDVKGKVFAKISLVNLKNFPLPNSSLNRRELLEEKVTQILSLKQLGEDTTALEREVDTMVYKLYDLTWEEACIIEENEAWMSKEEYDAYVIPVS